MIASNDPPGGDGLMVVKSVDGKNAAACPHRFSMQNRGRLSGPGLRTFERIADLWELTPRQRRLILGSPAASTYKGWLAAAANQDLALSVDVLMRMSAVLGIHAMLGIIYLDAGQPLAWLRAPCPTMPFMGRSPLEILTDGTFSGVMAVRNFLDEAIP